MKKFFLMTVVALLTCFSNLAADNKEFVGSFDRLAGVTKFNVVVDWSAYTINTSTRRSGCDSVMPSSPSGMPLRN